RKITFRADNLKFSETVKTGTGLATKFRAGYILSLAAAAFAGAPIVTGGSAMVNGFPTHVKTYPEIGVAGTVVIIAIAAAVITAAIIATTGRAAVITAAVTVTRAITFFDGVTGPADTLQLPVTHIVRINVVLFWIKLTAA
ncbi:hypothetical protein R0J87_18580, partial [Halomonas sp. SIMBA_159]